MDTPVLADLQQLVFISSVRTLCAVLKIFQERWPIETVGERWRKRESKESVLSACFDDDDDDPFKELISGTFSRMLRKIYNKAIQVEREIYWEVDTIAFQFYWTIIRSMRGDIIDVKSTMLNYIRKESLRRILEATAISLFKSLNTRPSFYNISPYLTKSLLNSNSIFHP